MDEYEKLDAAYAEAIKTLANYVRTVMELDDVDQEDLVATICSDVEGSI